MQEYLSACMFTIIPSEWYDNLPNTLLESYAMHKCVVATNIGSLTENVIDKRRDFYSSIKTWMNLREKLNFYLKIQIKLRNMVIMLDD